MPIRDLLYMILKDNLDIDKLFLLGVSGGPDSMAMIELFKRTPLNFEVLHCNFNLRGSESDGDEEFVRNYCHENSIPVTCKSFDTKKYAATQKISIEMAARELRYKWFEKMRKEKKAEYIAIAHHKDDMAETFFINLLRGTGIRGLSGIKEISGHIIRPMLSATREEIMEFVEDLDIPYRTDSTNSSERHVRNLLRSQVIPVFKKINPSFLNTMDENYSIFQEVEKIYLEGIQSMKEKIVEKKGEELRINIQRLFNCSAPTSLLHEILSPYGYNKTQIKNILFSLSANPGKKFISGEYVLLKDRKDLILYKKQESEEEIIIEGPGTYKIGNHILDCRFVPREEAILRMCKDTFPLDVMKVSFPLKIRKWENGDFFYPLGMGGKKKKLSDYFTDQKLSLQEKENVYILESKGNIVWVINHRPDERFTLSDDSILIFQLSAQPLP